MGAVAGVPGADAWGAGPCSSMTSLQVGMISSIRVVQPGRLPVAGARVALAGRAGSQPDAGVTGTLAFVVQVLTSVALGWDWSVAARVAAATVVQAAVTLACYRWRIGDDNLAPHRPSDIVDLLAGQHRRRRRGDAARPGARCLADQLALRAALVDRAEHRLRLRRQRLHHAARPAPSTHRGHPDPAARRLRPARGRRRVPRAWSSSTTTAR